MSPISEADRLFLTDFEACRLKAADFRHREHLRLAYVYLALHPFGIALEKMEAGLLRLLTHLGAPASKYHRTLTEAWLRAVAHFKDRIGATKSFDEFIAQAGPLIDQDAMLTHYTAERLWSEEARTAFVAPDLQPIPSHGD